MPNNIIYVSQNTIYSSSGINNNISGLEVSFASAKSNNFSKVNIENVVDDDKLRQEIELLQKNVTDQISLIGVMNNIIEETTEELAVAQASLAQQIAGGPFYCICERIDGVDEGCRRGSRRAACLACNSNNMVECMRESPNPSNSPGPPSYDLNVLGGCNTGYDSGIMITSGLEDDCPLSHSDNDLEQLKEWIKYLKDKLSSELKELRDYTQILRDILKHLRKKLDELNRINPVNPII